MIIRKVEETECVYLDERSTEFQRMHMILLGFVMIGSLFMIVLPLCLIIDMWFIIVGVLCCVGFAIYVVWRAFTMYVIYYDVWTVGEHRRIDKTGTDTDRVLIGEAADELEGILKERIKFGREMRK